MNKSIKQKELIKIFNTLGDEGNHSDDRRLAEYLSDRLTKNDIINLKKLIRLM